MTKIEMLAEVLHLLPEESQDNLKYHLKKGTPTGKPDDFSKVHASGGG